jgi:hypothetical protein
MLVEFISGIDPLILSPSPNPTSSRLSTGVGSFSYFCVSFCFHILQWNLFPSSSVTLAWLKFNIMFSYNLSSCKCSFCLLHLSLAVQCCYYICIPIALNKTSLDVYNAMVYEALSGSHLISLAYIIICFSQLFVGEGFNTTVKCPSSHHYR